MLVFIGVSLSVTMFLALPSVGVSKAESAAGKQYTSDNDEIRAARQRVATEDEKLQQKEGDISSTGNALEDSQAFLDAASQRSRELRVEAEDLDHELVQRKAARREAHRQYRESVVEAYKGAGVRDVDLVLEGLVGGGSVEGSSLSRILFEGHQTFQQYLRSEQLVKNTKRQISAKNEDYDRAVALEKRHAANLRERKRGLERAARNIKDDRKLSKILLHRLQREEKRKILESDPATGGSAGQRGREMDLSRKRIVAEEVDPIPRDQYLRLYRKSARDYGFANDWRILAAVGQVESNHGENMGPSSAGALGPMQFLPSTWVSAGVDGNGDGEANIMDPEDAIPAAARYLRSGGAPEDWHAALYSYNHAEWYVIKVLSVAEGYRAHSR